MKEIDQFVKRLFKKEPPQKENLNIIKEMLYEKVEDLKDAGLSEKAAIDKTITEFGDLEDFYLPNVEKEKKRYKRQKTIRHYKNDLLFASLSTLIIIAILFTVNINYFRSYGWWFIVASLGVLFWPLSILYKFLNKKGE